MMQVKRLAKSLIGIPIVRRSGCRLRHCACHPTGRIGSSNLSRANPAQIGLNGRHKPAKCQPNKRRTRGLARAIKEEAP
jgi:hypothetical protein